MGRPWEKLIEFSKASLESGKNGADIADGALQTASNVIFDNLVLEKAPGRTVLGTQLESGAAIDGLFRSWDKAANQKLLVMVNGKLKYWAGSAYTDLQTGLTVAKPADFLNHKDKTYIVNGYDDAYEFNPRTNGIQKAGIEPPRFYKKVAYFETDETISGTGDSNDTVVFRTGERTGTSVRSLKVTAGAGTTTTGIVTLAAALQNQNIFQNGTTIANDDYFCISIFHRTLAYISSISFDFITVAGSYRRATINSTDLDPLLQRDNQWTDVKIKRSRFELTGGSFNWASITSFQINLTSVTGEAVVNFDNAYWKNSPIEASSYRKDIEDFDGPTSDWTAGAGTLSYSSNYRYIKKGYSLILTNTNGSAYKTISPTLNLTVYQDGITSQTSDEICLWVYIASTANLTNIILRLYSDVTGGAEKYFETTYTGFNSSTTGGWNEIRVKKVDFHDDHGAGGAASWSGIIRLYLSLTTTGACTCYFDDCRMEEYAADLDIATMESSEAWTFSPTTCGGFNSNPDYVAHPGSATPSSIYMKIPAKKSYYAQLNYTGLNLTLFSAGVVSGTDDYICFWCYWTVFKTIKKIRITIFINDDLATDYYYYDITPEYMQEQMGLQNPKVSSMNKKSLNFQIAKSDFTRVGATAAQSWDDDTAVRFTVETVDKSSSPVKIYFDDLHMRRVSGITGVYQYCMVFGDDEGNYSAPSEWSTQATISGARGALRLLPVSADARVTKRLIYRRGGDSGSEARLAFIIYDNTSTTYYDDVQDNLLTDLLTNDDIPTGTIRFPLFAKFGPMFKGRAVGYRDPSNLRRFYYSNPDFIHAWSELQAWDFQTELINCWLDDGIYYFHTKSCIYRVSKDFGELTWNDFDEVETKKNAIGPWATVKCDDYGNALVATDGVYLFNGLQHEYISEDIKNYFDSATYDLDAVIAFYRKRHLYLSVKTVGGTRSILDYYIFGRKWRIADDSICAFCTFDGPTDNGEMYVGTTDGYIYQFDTGYSAASLAVTKDYPMTSNPFEEVVLQEIWVKARSVSSTPGAINIQFRVDQVLNGSITLSFPSTGNLAATYTTYFQQLLGVQDYLKGSKIGLSIAPGTNSKHFAIEGIYLRGSIAELPKTLEE